MDSIERTEKFLKLFNKLDEEGKKLLFELMIDSKSQQVIKETQVYPYPVPYPTYPISYPQWPSSPWITYTVGTSGINIKTTSGDVCV